TQSRFAAGDMPNIWQTPISSGPDSKPGRYLGRGDVGADIKAWRSLGGWGFSGATIEYKYPCI
ncbi:hypothetical protein, partial [Xanthomonas fragariae]|uniref:hypothetical protein n=1 Tax=Xanthomonas fragariae TaxID=48664 RepID=UPI003CCEEF9F